MIKSYYVDGEARDQEWIIDHREELEEGMRQDMRNHGWIPVLDIPINLTWEYNAEKNTFKFRMECKGKRVGRKKSMKAMGIMSQEGIEIRNDGEKLTLAIA